MEGAKRLSPEARGPLIATLEARFATHGDRRRGLRWPHVRERLEGAGERLWSLAEMERTGGEPDVVGLDGGTGEVVFFDGSPESPAGRRSLCYDRAGLESRRANRPEDGAADLAAAMGVGLLAEAQDRDLQALGEFDTKTSSWLSTPPEIRRLGGAIFGDRRFGRVFVYHNGAGAYYGSRGFRGSLRVESDLPNASDVDPKTIGSGGTPETSARTSLSRAACVRVPARREPLSRGGTSAAPPRSCSTSRAGTTRNPRRRPGAPHP